MTVQKLLFRAHVSIPHKEFDSLSQELRESLVAKAHAYTTSSDYRNFVYTLETWSPLAFELWLETDIPPSLLGL